MQSKATTVAEYLKSLPEDRRRAIEAVRKVILANLDPDIREGMQYGMIGYAVPHSVFPAGYHCDPKQPLPYAMLASQKQYMSLHLMSIYMHPENERWFREAWKKSGKKLDLGKACVRFRKLEDLALDVVGQAFRRVSAKSYLGVYVQSLEGRGASSGKPKTEKKTQKKPGKKVARKAASKRAAAAGRSGQAQALRTRSRSTR